MDYGYVSISRNGQNIKRQIKNILSAYPDAVIIQEAFADAAADRPEWAKLNTALSPGDTVIFNSVSDMSIDASDCIRIYEELFDRGVALVFLREPHLNTAVYQHSVPVTGTSSDIILDAVKRYLLTFAHEQIALAVQQAQKEADDLRQRTREGMMNAKRSGKQIGRKSGSIIETQKSKAAKEIIKKHSKSFGGTLSDAECQKLAGISRNSFYKYKRELASSPD